jgi:3-phenylpropionate/trans-cinnamate dioxygenase ferredoxin reductase subunit
VYAAGDICEYQSPSHGGTHVRIEHWDVAFNQGKTAALNMLGGDVAHTEVPYFFSDFADWGGLEYVGPALEWDEEVLRGSLDDASFSNWYLSGGIVKGALAVGRSDDLEAARRLISEGCVLSEDERRALANVDAELDSLGS